MRAWAAAVPLLPLVVGARPAGPAARHVGGPAVPACAPISDALRTATDARVAPGEYRLTLVAASGRRQGYEASGRLWLRPTSAADRSPRTGAAPARPETDTLAHPLYGATDLDFRRGGAPGRPGGPGPRAPAGGVGACAYTCIDGKRK